MTLLLIVAALPWVLSLLLRIRSRPHRPSTQSVDRRHTTAHPVGGHRVFGAASLTALAAVFLATGGPVWLTLGIIISAWMFWRWSRSPAMFDASPSVRPSHPNSVTSADDGRHRRRRLRCSRRFCCPLGRRCRRDHHGIAEALSNNELHAVIEHERAHLRHRHSVWIQMCEIAALSIRSRTVDREGTACRGASGRRKRGGAGPSRCVVCHCQNCSASEPARPWNTHSRQYRR